MSRSLSVAVKEFIDMWTAPSPPISLEQPQYTITHTKYPYEHRTTTRRCYTYNVRDGYNLIMKKPWDIDLMGNFITSNQIHAVLKDITAPPDYDEYNKYKQIVVHHRTYTGVINMASGTEEKVVEITLQ